MRLLKPLQDWRETRTPEVAAEPAAGNLVGVHSNPFSLPGPGGTDPGLRDTTPTWTTRASLLESPMNDGDVGLLRADVRGQAASDVGVRKELWSTASHVGVHQE